MFGFFKPTKQIIMSPVDGDLVPLEEVPDEVFSQKLSGDGMAIVPLSGTVVAPIDGVVSRIFPTNHAFLITKSNGLEVMVHIGLDTVELKGQGFKRLVEEGTKVQSGCPIIAVDLLYLEEQGKNIITPVLINCDKSIELEKHKIGTIREGESLMEVKFL
ncbi:MAG TPA: PTS glucose transporter subunit IIA [Campylobacterales bacterium]|nr:PTS glucose transporter subunit IIA [Campylobacterales bacterium]HIP42085.1 PTS glucose transporter subunit IIA [Campylobacterales bacterium]